MAERLFSYGTLRLSRVQKALFGRVVHTVEDRLPGFRVEWLTITDAGVVAASGSDRHPILRAALPTDSVAGAYLELDEHDLARADQYEVDDYVRRRVRLSSGVEAWAYLASSVAPRLNRR